MDEEEVHIAVGKNFKKEKANILWTAAYFPRSTLVLVHVHWPSMWMPCSGGMVLYKVADEGEKKIHRTTQTEAMAQMISKYKGLCAAREIRAYYLVHNDILAGVVNLVKKLNIKRIVIGSRSMTAQEVLCKYCQVWVVRSGKHMSTSDDHMDNTGSIGYVGWPESLASKHEWSGSDGYITAPSDFEDDIIDEDEEAEQGLEESNASEQEVADQSDEIHSSQNTTRKAEKLMKEIDRLQRELKELQDHGHNHEKTTLSPMQKVASLVKKTVSKKRYPELKIPYNLAQLSMTQLEKATNYFYPRNLIGEGGYGTVYKGTLGGIAVAIKLLGPRGTQGFPEFKQEVVLLSRIEHPHIVRLLGVCPESCGLVYEHLPNGTLLDSLSRGLPWEDRVRILSEQRLALAHLHSGRPHVIIHGDVKLTNILLDAGNVSRLGDFGTARMVRIRPLEEKTICRRTNPMGTKGYMDPVFFVTGELTPESDVYSFGVVILQVLTGRLVCDIAERVREAIKTRAARGLLDVSAGSWPGAKAEMLLRLGLRCCSIKRKHRPTTLSDADWKPLDNLLALSTRSRKGNRGG